MFIRTSTSVASRQVRPPFNYYTVTYSQ